MNAKALGRGYHCLGAGFTGSPENRHWESAGHRLFGKRFVVFPKPFTVGFSLRGKKAGRDMLWPRSLSATCPPCDSASAIVCLVRLVSLESAFSPPPNLASVRPPCLRHVSAVCPLWPRLQTLSAVCPLCQLRSIMRPRLWTLSSRGLLWGRAVAL